MTIFAGRRRRSLPLSLVVLLNVVLYAEYVSGSRELIVRPSGESFAKMIGTSIVFTCEVRGLNEGEPIPDFGLKWFHNNAQIIDQVGRVFIEVKEEFPTTIQILYIINIKDEDEGEYHCIADIDGMQRKKSLMLSISKEITFDAPEVQHPAINTDAVIQCRVSGKPVPEISWRYKGVRVQIGGRFEMVTDGLRIRNITLNDDGIYICRAEVDSDGRYDERRISVAVHIPPSITEGPGTSEGIDGEDLYISCKADGLPPPEFQYYKIFQDGSSNPLVPSERVKIDPKTGNIFFNPLKKEDEGKYTCLAHNDVGNRTSDGVIIVNDHQVLTKNAEAWSDSSTVFQFQTREATPSEVARIQEASVASGAIVGIVVFIFIVLLVVIDISCYFANNCGVTTCICVHLCDKSATFKNEKAVEEGKRHCLTAENDKETEKEMEKLIEVSMEGMDGQKEEMESN